MPSQVSDHCNNLILSATIPIPQNQTAATYEYVPGASKGELPKYILAKLKALLILSVLNHLAHRP